MRMFSLCLLAALLLALLFWLQCNADKTGEASNLKWLLAIILIIIILKILAE